MADNLPVAVHGAGPGSVRLASFVFLVAALLLSGKALADPFVGHFEGDIDGVSHELILYSDSAGVYDGELRGAGDRVPVFGNRYGDFMIGKIGFPDDQFEFRARALGALLVIERRAATPLKFFRKTD